MIPVIALLLYIGMALKIFVDDKIAYVYESASSASRSLSSQVNLQLSGALSSIRPVLQEFAEKREFGKIAKTTIVVDTRFLSVSSFTSDQDGKVTRAETIEKFPGQVESFFSAIGGDEDYLKKLISEWSEENPRVLKFPFRDDRAVILEKVQDSVTKNFVYFLLVVKLGDVVQEFQVPSQFTSLLVSKSGEVVLSPSDYKIKSLSEIGRFSFVSKSNKEFNSGTEEVQNTQGQVDLVSYSKTGFDQFWTVTFVSKKEALSAVEVLIWKSIFFFFILICGIVIVSLIASSGITSSLLDLFAATKRVSEGNFDIRVKVNSADEVGSLAQSFNAMADEVSRLLSETAEKARMQAELKTAQTVQETLFPANAAELGGLHIVGRYEPASECGGDWWHYSMIANRPFLWIGDATGHGAPAALITSAARSAASIIEGFKVSPAIVLNLMNRAIFDVSKGKIMMTFFVASYDPERKVLTYANASHEAPFLLKKMDRPIKKKDLIVLNEVSDARLGQARESRYREAEISLEPGDRVLFYTDGVMDLQNKEKESLGERNFLKIFLEAHSSSAVLGSVVDSMHEKLLAHRQQSVLIDDVTYFMMQVKEQV